MTTDQSELLELKAELQRELARTESVIFHLETCYLEEALRSGGQVRCWESAASRSASRAGLGKRPLPSERVFSMSSMTSGVHRLIDEDATAGGSEQYKSYLQKRKPAKVLPAKREEPTARERRKSGVRSKKN